MDGDSRIVFYAATPGALVDLAADLSHALGVPTITGRVSDGGEPADVAGHDAAIRLDDDLPPVSMVSGLVGLAELSTINRAAGFLIGQGHLPVDAHDTLRRGASAAGLDTHLFAARLLRR